MTRPAVVPIGLALLAVGLLGGVAGTAVQEGNTSAQAEAQVRMRSIRDSAVRALVRQSDDYKRAVATWAVNPALIEGLREPTPSSQDRAKDQLAILAAVHGSPGAFVTDVMGSALAVYPSRPEVIGNVYSFRDWYQGASRTGRPYVSSGYVSISNENRLVVGVATPVLDGPRRVGYVTLLWGLDSVRSVVEGSHRDDDVAITVTDQHGQSLTGTVIVDQRGQPRQVAVSASTKQALAGQSVNSVSDGVIQSEGPVPGIGWTVTAAVSSSVALAPARSFQHQLEAVLAAALLMVLLAAALAGRVAHRRVVEGEARRKAEKAVRISEGRFRRLFDEALYSKILMSSDGDIIRVNDTVVRLLGRQPPWFIGKPLVALFADEADRARILAFVQDGDDELCTEMALEDPGGRSLWGLVALSWMDEVDGERIMLAQIEDITARRAAEQRLTQLTLHDELTGLPNRRLLVERCERAFARAKSDRSESSTVVAFFIDLDGFKPINDGAGHETGDQVLIAVAHDLQTCLRPADTVARVGGDEFVVLIEQDGLEQDHELAYLRTVANRLVSVVRRKVITDKGSLTLTASVGIGRVDLACEPDVNPEQLLRRADAAMYRAKECGRDRHDVFDVVLHENRLCRER